MNNKTYYVAAYRPPYPERGLKLVVFPEKDYSIDGVPPTMTALFRVQYVNNREEAIAAVVERAAGKGTAVSQVI